MAQRFDKGFPRLPGLASGHFHFESNRFKTFLHRDENQPIFACSFAKSGLYLDGSVVKCYACSFSKSIWQHGDKPLDIHREHSPRCSFFDGNPLVGDQAANVPLPAVTKLRNRHLDVRTADATDLQTSQSESHQQCQCDKENDIDVFAERIRRETAVVLRPNRNRPQPQMQDVGLDMRAAQPTAETRMRGITLNFVSWRQEIVRALNQELGTEKYPGYADEDKRLRSFSARRFRSPVPKEDLAHMGFYYAGHEDLCICYYCGLMIHRWSAEDDPAITHARHQPKCAHVINAMGDTFPSFAQSELGVVGHSR